MNDFFDFKITNPKATAKYIKWLNVTNEPRDWALII